MKITSILVIKENLEGDYYDVYQRSVGVEDRLLFCTFSKEEYTIRKVKGWVRACGGIYKRCKIIVEV